MYTLSREQKFWFFGGATLLIILSLTWLMRPMYDPDFFWHLKTGQWIWQTQSLPISDPFSFTTPLDLDWRQRFILSSYWLVQLIYYGFHELGGWWGIFSLRYLVVASLLVVFYLFRQGDRLIWFVFSSMALVLILETYPVERPQFLSFVLFAGLYLYLDKRFSQGRSVKYATELLCIVLVMVFWANVHGGVVLGQGLLVLTGLWALVGMLRGRRNARPVVRDVEHLLSP